MKVALKDLKPNPFRNFDLYPIFPEWVEQLKDSIAHTGYWNGFLAREKDGEYQMPYGHHRKQALEELHGAEYEVEVQLEDMPDNLMRQRMFRENVRNEAQDSAVILHDIEVAKKFPSDWQSITMVPENELRDNKTLAQIAIFIGRDFGSVKRTYYARKTKKREGLTKEELSNMRPRTAEVIAQEIRRQKPSLKARQQIIQEAKESNVGPKTAKNRMRDIILQEKYPDKVPSTEVKKQPDIHEYIAEKVLPTAQKLSLELDKIVSHTEAINPDALQVLGLATLLEKIETQIKNLRDGGML